MQSPGLPLSSVVVGASAATFLFMTTFMGVGELRAGEGVLPGTTLHADAAHNWRPEIAPAPFAAITPHRRETPSVPGYIAPPEPGDRLAALEAVEIALTQAGDGATYVWRRHNGRLAGTVRPTSTFRDTDGRICRHIEMQMRLGTYQRRTEGIACRSGDGVWDLEG